MSKQTVSLIFSALTLLVASCGGSNLGDNAVAGVPAREAFAIEEIAAFDEPWAMAIDRATGIVFVTEKKGRIRFVGPNGKTGTVSGVPPVDYGGQGGLGDIVFAPDTGTDGREPETRTGPDRRTVYLSWVEAGSGKTRGAVVGKAQMVCNDQSGCALQDLTVIWRQQPKVTGHGHYSHRIAFSPDGRHLFIASGDRQKLSPAQDLSNTLGTIVRLLPDGTPAPGNPFADKGSPSDQIWSYGHRNILGLAFDAQGQLWDVEHGPAGGDELNLVERGANYGWPEASDGQHYGGDPIPDHAQKPQFSAPAISWNPVIAPGGMIFYTGDLFAQWKDQVLIAAMRPAGIVRVAKTGGKAREMARYSTENRIRAIAQTANGAILVLEDGSSPEQGRLLKLTPANNR